MKKIICLLLMPLLAGMITVEAATYKSVVNGRDDGTWLFPIAQADYNSINDWAGCSNGTNGASNPCIFDGANHYDWGDSSHRGQSVFGHNGIDISVSYKNVLATAAGTVRVAATGYNGGRGSYVVIEHPIDSSRSYYSVYQHLNSVSKSVGNSVNAGDVIGVSGNTGDSGGPHLHFAILIGSKGYAQSVGTMEGGGWFLKPGTESYNDRNTKSGKTYGRVLNNPSTATYSAYSIKIEYPGSLEAHCGSVTYTFDKSKVKIGDAVTTTDVTAGEYVLRCGSLYLNASEDWNGANVNAVTANNTKAQRWTIAKSGSSYRITSQTGSASRVLNVYTDGTSAAGINVTLWAVTGHQTQLWLFEKSGDGYIIHPSDNTGVALAVVANNDVKLAANSGAASQIWYLEAPPAQISNVTVSSGKASAQVTAPAGGTVVFAFYNGNRLLNLHMETKTGSVAVSNISIPNGATRVKVMLWNNLTAMQQLCASVEKAI